MKLKLPFKWTGIVLTWLWLALLALVPHSLVLLISLLKKGIGELVDFRFSLVNYLTLLDPIYFKVWRHSIVIAVACTLLCLLFAYPFAYLLARLQYRYKNRLLLLVIIPFWTSSLIRTYAIIAILKTKGLLNSVLLSLGLIQRPLSLLYTHTAVVIGLVYSLLPFMILPLYASLEKLDSRYIDAARDLGATKLTILFRIILPLTLPGISAGILLVFLPAVSLFYIPDVLGGAKSLLIGNLIQNQFLLAHNWPVGAAISIVLTVIMAGMLLIYQCIDKKDSIHQGLL